MTRNAERGAVLIVVLVMTVLLAALGAALTLATTTEVAIAANYREASETLYAAEAALAFVTQEIAVVEDWTTLASSAGESVFVDGSPSGSRTVGAVALDLTDATDALNAIRPAGPPWTLYAYGPFPDLVPTSVGRAPIYVAVWLANHASSADPALAGAISLFGQAFGPRGSRRAVEIVVEKADASSVRRRSWREWP